MGKRWGVYTMNPDTAEPELWLLFRFTREGRRDANKWMRFQEMNGNPARIDIVNKTL